MQYDLFVSHSSKDKEQYILPLCQNFERNNIKFWLDSVEIGWGDNVVDKINRGIAISDYMLICLSENFVLSNWTNAEFTSVYSIQNNSGKKKVLPLILNSKEDVLEKYPLLQSLKYKEFSTGIEIITEDLIKLISPANNKQEAFFEISTESKYSGKSFNFKVPGKASFGYLRDRAINTIGLNDSFDIGTSNPFKIKWILVDINADEEWLKLATEEQSRLTAFIKNQNGFVKIFSEFDKLENNISDNARFYLYPVEQLISGGGGGRRAFRDPD